MPRGATTANHGLFRILEKRVFVMGNSERSRMNHFLHLVPKAAYFIVICGIFGRIDDETLQFLMTKFTVHQFISLNLR